MENYFIDALVKASSCKHHTQLAASKPISTSWFSWHPKPRRRSFQKSIDHPRAFHRLSSNRSPSPPVRPDATREDYKRMLDYYESFHTQCEPSILPQHPPKLPQREIEASNLSIEEHDSGEGDGSNPQFASVIDHTIRMVNDESSTHEAIYESYCALPSPQPLQLPPDILRLLLHRLSVVERKTEAGMVRYLSILDDMKTAKIPISLYEWSSGIAFAGRCFARVSAADVESALRIWKEMEQEAGVQGSNVTFNILFDVATKAGKFVLAEMILQEMQARKLRINRYARVGLIYYHGLRGDGNGIRKAYRDLIDDGHIVDTVVLNCAIASLIRAGEPSAAEHVYERMKSMHARLTGAKLPSLDWKGSRELGRLLDRAARDFGRDKEKIQQLQNQQSLAPNVRTYIILVGYHTSRTGELQRVAQLLDELQFLGLPLHGSLFRQIFRGFALHGGERYTSWTGARLESVWGSFQRALDQDVSGVFVGKWIVIWVFRAFAKCCGDERSLEIWETLKSRWNLDEAEFERIRRE